MFNLFSSKPIECAQRHTISGKFKFTIDQFRVKDGRHGPKKEYCKEHFLEEWFKAINQNPFPLVFIEPLDHKEGAFKNSQAIFYEIEELKIDNFSREDEVDMHNLLKNVTKDKSIVWLPKSTILSVHDLPVVKVKDGFEVISIDELKSRLRTVFSQYIKFEKGQFQINLPSGEAPGVYLYYTYI